MKKSLVVALAVVTLAGCMKDEKCSYRDNYLIAPTSEQEALTTYLDTSGIVATHDSSGFYYNIMEPGTGGSPTVCSQISFQYKGWLTDGTVFDSTATGNYVVYDLGALIEGWRKGLKLIGKGGSIRLYLPPSLGYGSQSVGGIPGNSILIFDVTLGDFN